MDDIQKLCKACKAVYDYLEQVPACERQRRKIEKKIRTLNGIAEIFKSAGVKNLPPACREGFRNSMDSLSKCKKTCDDLSSEGVVGKYWNAQKNTQSVQTLEKELSDVCQTLHLFFGCMLLAKVDGISEALCELDERVAKNGYEMSRKIDEAADRLERTVINPGVGVLPGVYNCREPPRAPGKPNVSVEGIDDDVMLIKWNYTEDPSKPIFGYNICYNGQILFESPQNLQLPSNESKNYSYSMGVSPPKIIAGKKYTIRVQAVSKNGGYSDWSEAVVCMYKAGPPNKPHKPIVTVNSPKCITFNIEPLAEDDENGSPVTECIVEIDTDTPHHFNYKMNQFPVHFTVAPDTKYIFKVKMVNAFGPGPPSDVVKVRTEELIPGAPVDVRISSKRTRDTIKVRWKPPAENPEVACKYEIQMRQDKSMQWYPVRQGVERLSARIRHLKTDTKYFFCVCALNNKDHPGNFSEEVEAETRYGMGVGVVATTGMFIGATILAPATGLMTFGYCSGKDAADSVNNKPGSVVAGVGAGVGGGIAGALLGVVGAPFFGASSAYSAYKIVSGEWLTESPQSSDDES